MKVGSDIWDAALRVREREVLHVSRHLTAPVRYRLQQKSINARVSPHRSRYLGRTGIINGLANVEHGAIIKSTQ